MKLPDRSVLSLARTCLLVAIFAMTPPTTRVQAQLFDGLPKPSHEQYGLMWETITGYDYVEDASALFLGYEVGGNTDTFELVAFQPAQDGGTETIAAPVGTITVLESHPYQWLLPFRHVFDADDGTDQYQVAVELSLGAAAVHFTGDNGVVEYGVSVMCTTTMEVLSGTGDDVGETATYTIIVPLGFVNDPLEAAEIAQRIADMDIYDGDPIDPNDMRFGSFEINPDRQHRICDTNYKFDIAICHSILKGASKKCIFALPAGMIAGCVSGAPLCALVPPPGAPAIACCVVGGAAGGIAGVVACETKAQWDFDTCARNAYINWLRCEQLEAEREGTEIGP